MFSLNFATDNAAFTENREAEIARILREIADNVQRGPYESGRVRDGNGNSVGAWHID